MDHDTPHSQSTSESLAAASADAEPSPAWADELALAREALKERVQQQQAADGSIEIPHLPSPPSPPPPDELLQTEVHKEEGAVTAANAEQQDRRGSTASTGEAEGLHVEDEEEDWVHTHLTGLRRRRPEMAESASAAGGAASREGAEGASSAAAAEEEKTCRICFGGSEEVEELGKLFSPCQCRGTSRYVHVACLERWRKASANSASFYACDQCGYQYRFRRTRLAALVTSRFTLLTMTVAIFSLLIYIAGFAANWMISIAETRRAQMSGSMFEEIFVSDHVILSEGVREAVSFFDTRLASLARPAIEYDVDEEDDRPWTSRFYEVLRNPTASATRKTKRSKRIRPPSWLFGTLLHMVKGISLVGIAAAFHGYIATSFLSPIARGMFRAVRPQARRGGARDAAANNMSQLVAVVFVILGVIKAVSSVYRGVKWLSKVALSRVENLVLDV